MPRHIAHPRAILPLAWLLITATSAFAFTQPEQQPQTTDDPARLISPDFSTLKSGLVTRVLDQNTLLIEIDGRTTRCDLLGVSASSGPQNRENDTLAIEVLTNLTLGETVLLQDDPSGPLNHANRRAAYIFRAPDHLFVNLELVRQGYTRHNAVSMTIHTQIFEHYETRARDLARGIWDPNPPRRRASTDNADQDQHHEPAQEQTQTTQATPGTVYITAHGTKYHREDCPHLTDSARPTTRTKIQDSHQPCKTCKPDTP